MESTEKTLTLEEKFGISEKKTLREYVLWLETDGGNKFVDEIYNRLIKSSFSSGLLKAILIRNYALEIVTE